MCHCDIIPDFYQLDTVRSSSSQECKQSSIKREKTEQKKNLVPDRNCDPLFQGSINPDTQTALTWLAPRPRTTARQGCCCRKCQLLILSLPSYRFLTVDDDDDQRALDLPWWGVECILGKFSGLIKQLGGSQVQTLPPCSSLEESGSGSTLSNSSCPDIGSWS